MNKRNFIKNITGLTALFGIGAAKATNDIKYSTESVGFSWVELPNKAEDLRLRISADQNDDGFYDEFIYTKIYFEGVLASDHPDTKELAIQTIDEKGGFVLAYDYRRTDPFRIWDFVYGDFTVDYTESERRAIIDFQKHHIDRSVPEAMETMKANMREDDGWAFSWHCNIAQASNLNGLDWHKSQKAAASFMRTAFDEVLRGQKHYRTNKKKDIAKKAAKARWSSSVPVALHDGVISLGESEIQCYVLEDETRILSTRGVMKTLGRAWRRQKKCRYQTTRFS